MPEFETPQPISATIEFDLGSARITASERTDTVVEVLPRDGAEEDDVRAAQQTKVSYADGKLLVKGPRRRSLFGKPGALELHIELPAGSEIQGNAPIADFNCVGSLGECRLKTSLGDLQVEQAAAVTLRTSRGDIRVGRAEGNAEISGSGLVELGEIAGPATVKNLNGDITIGEVTGELKVNSSNGRISVGVAGSGVDAKSASGGIRIGAAVRGQVVLNTAVGDIEVGIPEATAAWLDVNTRVGMVRNSLSPSEGPGSSEHTVEVRARSGAGDIVIQRS